MLFKVLLGLVFLDLSKCAEYHLIEKRGMKNVNASFYHSVNSFIKTYIKTAETATELEVQRAISRGPQSFSILMNFGHDGTTSLQIIGSNSVYWADFGYCKRIIYLIFFHIFCKLSIYIL
jgi:hypothetical protein